MSIQISAIYQGQLVANSATKLVFTSLNSVLNGGTVVPTNAVVLLTSLWVTNTTGSIVTLKLWRGTAATDAFLLTPGPINVPPSTFATPGFQALSAPIALMAGDAIWGIAGTASALAVTGDGEVIVP